MQHKYGAIFSIFLQSMKVQHIITLCYNVMMEKIHYNAGKRMIPSHEKLPVQCKTMENKGSLLV